MTTDAVTTVEVPLELIREIIAKSPSMRAMRMIERVYPAISLHDAMALYDGCQAAYKNHKAAAGEEAV